MVNSNNFTELISVEFEKSTLYVNIYDNMIYNIGIQNFY